MYKRFSTTNRLVLGAPTAKNTWMTPERMKAKTIIILRPIISYMNPPKMIKIMMIALDIWLMWPRRFVASSLVRS
jgi:hypothetical protein